LSGPPGHLPGYGPLGKVLEVLQYTCGRARTQALHLHQDCSLKTGSEGAGIALRLRSGSALRFERQYKYLWHRQVVGQRKNKWGTKALREI